MKRRDKPSIHSSKSPEEERAYSGSESCIAEAACTKYKALRKAYSNETIVKHSCKGSHTAGPHSSAHMELDVCGNKPEPGLLLVTDVSDVGDYEQV